MSKPLRQEEIVALVDATMKIIDSSKESKDGRSITPELNYLYIFIASMIARTLNDGMNKDGMSKKEKFEYTKNNFSLLKKGLQMAVAHSFQTSMEQFSSMPVDYYCIITTAQNSNSKETH